MSVPHHSLDMMRCDLEIHCWRRVAKWSWLVLPLLLLLVVAGCQRRSSNAAEPTIQVYAASSLTDVLNRIRDDFQKQSPYRVELTLDSSATLAKQIEQGAPADLFISANRQWADYVVEKLGDRASAPKDLLSNRLVLIAERDAQLEVNQLSDLVHVPDLRLALGNPESVPAGIYAKQVLEAEQLWEPLSDKILPADNVRAALQYVETGSAVAAIVYATDVSPTAGVRVLLEIDASLHEPIVYPMVSLRRPGASSHGDAWVKFLQSERAAKHFTELGFVRIPGNAQ